MSDGKIRLFVAVEVPESLRLWLAEQTETLRNELRGGRWTDVADQHVTCKFLGWTPGDRIEEVEATMQSVAASHAPARLTVGGLGGFPSDRRVRVLWAGLVDDSGLLARLARDLDRGFEKMGWAPEDRPFRAHLTLARFKTPVRVREPLPALDLSAVNPFVVDGLVLFRSRLSPAGARYEALSRAPLKGAAERDVP